MVGAGLTAFEKGNLWNIKNFPSLTSRLSHLLHMMFSFSSCLELPS